MGILVHQGHSKIIIIINFAIAITKYQHLNHLLQHDDDDDQNPEDIPTEDIPIGKSSVGISSAHHDDDDDDDHNDNNDEQ